MDYTVVIPARNEEACIARAISSAVEQSLPPREVIVVDDGSTDGTGQAASAFPSVRVIRHEAPAGLSVARNDGIAAATTAWIAFLDADDQWHPDKMDCQADVAKTTGAGVIYCGILQRWQDDGPSAKILAPHFLYPGALRRALLLRNCITGSGSAVVARRDLLTQAGGFDVSLARSEDRDMWIRLSWLTRFAAVERPLVTIWKRPGRHGSDPEAMFQAGLAVITKNRELYRRYSDGRVLWRRAVAALYERRGMAYISSGQLRLARRDFFTAARRWPFRLKTVVPLAKLCLGLVRPRETPSDGTEVG
jgi:glycosyltransferase involved in cell wall biosynthesis